MLHTVVLGMDYKRAVLYETRNMESHRQFTFIGDENAENKYRRKEDSSDIYRESSVYLLRKMEPQDCHALVYADEVMLVNATDQIKLYADYLTAVFSMRAQTNFGQPLRILYEKEAEQAVQCFLNKVVQHLCPSAAFWYYRMVTRKGLASF